MKKSCLVIRTARRMVEPALSHDALILYGVVLLCLAVGIPSYMWLGPGDDSLFTIILFGLVTGAGIVFCLAASVYILFTFGAWACGCIGRGGIRGGLAEMGTTILEGLKSQATLIALIAASLISGFVTYILISTPDRNLEDYVVGTVLLGFLFFMLYAFLAAWLISAYEKAVADCK